MDRELNGREHVLSDPDILLNIAYGGGRITEVKFCGELFADPGYAASRCEAPGHCRHGAHERRHQANTAPCWPEAMSRAEASSQRSLAVLRRQMQVPTAWRLRSCALQTRFGWVWFSCVTYLKAALVQNESLSTNELVNNARLCNYYVDASGNGLRGACGKTSQGNIENRLNTVRNDWKFIENRKTE